ncbi:transposase [Thalassotalea sp. G20_0]|uniref:transposase n=1 Tax=Thalassotalea sp. G20_0 TaxID=2821093 RepID=UPI001ADA5E48|nr:transposase [Thalassotalea sp. G20_0]
MFTVPTSNRKTVAEKLISIVSKEAAKIPDFRPGKSQDAISLHDAIMSGLAVMHLKYPSLLQFDRDCVKKPDSKNPQYYHQLLACCLVKPGKKEVLPLMPEPIIQQVNASKNDCEKTALKRLLSNISREHPHLKLVLNGDDLYSDGPTINLVKSYGYSFIMVAKDTSHPSLYESVDELDKADKVVRYQYTDEKGYRHWFRFVNDVPINKSHKETLVNYLEYVEIDPKGNKKYVNTWITDIKLTLENVAKVMRGGRARWKIENETFNTLKTQGYHLEHNYGHGEQHLATNLACLTFTAFLINQIEQLACKFFLQALEAKKSKKRYGLGYEAYLTGFSSITGKMCTQRLLVAGVSA